MALVERLKFDPERIVSLSESPDPAQAATAANVRRAFATLRGQAEAGRPPVRLPDRPRHVRRRRREVQPRRTRHGSRRMVGAGARLSRPRWSSSIRRPASSPFIERLERPRRIVVSATDSVAQRFDTVFPEYFIAAFSEEAVGHRQERQDVDLGGLRLGRGRRAAALSAARPARDGTAAARRQRRRRRPRGVVPGRSTDAFASRTYLDCPPPARRRQTTCSSSCCSAGPRSLAEAEELQVKKAFMAPDEYAREFERIMLALARVGRDIRGEESELA